MDTVSHIIIGFGLGALAQMDPVISNDPALSSSVLIGTVIGSNAPDFDFVYRLKGKSSYFRNHRGWSHSLPAIPIWGLAAASLIYPFFQGTSFTHLLFWTVLAVVLHVLLDVFNVNGTKALLPISSRWISLDFLPLVDPYIIVLHLLGFSLLPFFEPGNIFIAIYLGILLYLMVRMMSTHLTKWKLKQHFQNALQIKLIPKMAPFHWNILIESNEDFLFGYYSEGELWIEHTFSKKIEYPGLILDGSNDKQISDFLKGTHFAYPFVQKRKSGYLICWKDLRYRSKKFFPKLAILFISTDLTKQTSYTGKISSIKQYKKIIRELESAVKLQ